MVGKICVMEIKWGHSSGVLPSIKPSNPLTFSPLTWVAGKWILSFPSRWLHRHTVTDHYKAPGVPTQYHYPSGIVGYAVAETKITFHYPLWLVATRLFTHLVHDGDRADRNGTRLTGSSVSIHPSSKFWGGRQNWRMKEALNTDVFIILQPTYSFINILVQ